MTRWVTAALALCVICTVSLAAAEPAKKPVGTFTKKEGDISITFAIKADGMIVTIKGEGDRKIETTADYGLSKDGVLFGRISKIKKEGVEGGPEEGDHDRVRPRGSGSPATLRGSVAALACHSQASLAH